MKNTYPKIYGRTGLKSIFILVIILINYGLIPYEDKQTLPSGIEDVEKWIEENFAKGKLPPFSFVLGGKSSDKFIRSWQFNAEVIKATDPDTEEIIYTYYDKQSGLKVKCILTRFLDFPAVEWVIRFSNVSGKNTPVIEDAAVINKSFVSGNGNFILHHARGSDALRSDFQPINETLVQGKDIYLTPPRGRSSEAAAFPFFNIEMPGNHGIMVAVGWSGKWYADVVRGTENSVTLRSGMERMQLILHPGEEIRTPKICLLFWKGENRMAGHNQFRQFILAHHSRKINNTFAEYPLSGSFDYGDPLPCNEYECLTEDYAIAIVKRCQSFGVVPEVFWLDAGWYTGCGGLIENGRWWQNVGNWSADKDRFPNGLKAVSDAVHATGAKFMVWFEPERVRPGTMIDREHPEWLIKIQGNDNYLFNLGNKEARIWLTDYISDMIRKEGIDYYRQDFNMDPLPFWQAEDKPGRIGIPEVRHIEGLYEFWDSLLVRFPDLLIDNCASGGRRIDLETTTRSAPLWRTDYQYGEPNGYQCHTFGLHFYLPLHGTAIYGTDSYIFRSGLGAATVVNWEVTGRNSEPIPDIQKCMREYKKLRPYYYGDFYPLTESVNNTRDDVWLAYQMNRPKEKDGIIIAFRRSQNNEETIHSRLSGLEKDVVYELFYEDYGLRILKTGLELMEGFDLTIPRKQSSLLISYRSAGEE